MNTLNHAGGIEMDTDPLRQLGDVAARALQIVAVALVFAATFAAMVAFRFAAMASGHPVIAATLHRVACAVGLAS
jgi:hypothetical protein